MYLCHVEKLVWRQAGQRGGYTPVGFDLEVAEPPRPGGELHLGRWFSGPLTFVVWDLDAERFECRVADEEPHTDLGEHFDHDFLLQNALWEGWLRVHG